MSYAHGVANRRAAAEVAELMAAMGIGAVALGMECAAGAGPVALPEGPESVVLVASEGVELGHSCMGRGALSGMALDSTELREIPLSCFHGCRNLVLASLPANCLNIRDVAFADCRSLMELELTTVGIVGDLAFHGCCSLRGLGSHNGLSIVGLEAFACTAIVLFEVARLSFFSGSGFRGSALESFSGKCALWRGTPFENCQNLRRLELWPDNGFDPLQLVGNAPEEIRFHATPAMALSVFGDLLRGSVTRMVAGTGQVISVGPATPEAILGGRAITVAGMPILSISRDVAVRHIDLRVLLRGSLEGTLEGFLWIESVLLPVWLEELP